MPFISQTKLKPTFLFFDENSPCWYIADSEKAKELGIEKTEVMVKKKAQVRYLLNGGLSSVFISGISYFTKQGDYKSDKLLLHMTDAIDGSRWALTRGLTTRFTMQVLYILKNLINDYKKVFTVYLASKDGVPTFPCFLENNNNLLKIDWETLPRSVHGVEWYKILFDIKEPPMFKTEDGDEKISYKALTGEIKSFVDELNAHILTSQSTIEYSPEQLAEIIGVDTEDENPF